MQKMFIYCQIKLFTKLVENNEKKNCCSIMHILCCSSVQFSSEKDLDYLDDILVMYNIHENKINKYIVPSPLLCTLEITLALKIKKVLLKKCLGNTILLIVH